MKTQDYRDITFLKSAAELKQLPPDTGYEVAFAGRSNAGKSSALNALTGNKKMAKTSKTPGRTQLINLFTIDEERRLVDLPGYGYAKVSESIKQRWQKTLARYLEKRTCLRGLVLIMDIRHPLKDMDRHIIEWAIQAQLPIHILLSKADKLKRSPALNTLQSVSKTFSPYGDLVTVQLFSATKREGIETLTAQLNQWFYE